jgi:hypothetical protein
MSMDVECAPTVVFDTIVVTSLRNTPITMSMPVVTNAAVTVVLPTSDVVIPPLGTQPVVVRYDPALANSVSTFMTITFPVDSSEFVVPIEARYTLGSWTTSADIVDADTLALCDTFRSFPITITNTGDVDEIIDGNAGTLPPGFAVRPQSTVLPAGTSAVIMIDVDPALLSTGMNTAAIVLTGQSCGVQRTITATAFIVGGRLILAPDPVAAGTIPVGQFVVLPVTISNPTSTPRRVVSLDVNPSHPSWTVLDNVAGLVLNPGQSRTVSVEFRAQSVGDASTRLVLIDAERCTTVSSVALTGRGRDPDAPPDHVALLRINRYAVAPESKVEIPVYWDADVRAAQVQSADIRVSFAYLNLSIDSVSAGAMADAQITTSWDPGNIQFMVTRTGPACGSAGTIGVIHGVAHSALPDSTELVFAYVQIAAGETVAVKDEPGVLIVDACGPRNAIVFSAPTSVVFLPPHPARETIQMQVVAPYSETLHVEAVSVIGDVQILVPTATVAKGTSVVDVPLSDLQAGTYILRVTTDRGGVFSIPRIVIR